jgi:ketopantoate reductase
MWFRWPDSELRGKYRRLKSARLQPPERGRLTESDYFNGNIVRNATKYCIHVPVNSAVTNMIHEIEMNKRAITVNTFDDQVFDRFN